LSGQLSRFALAWLVSVCVGCTSAPVRYYTLTPPTYKALPAPETILAIEVRVVHLPPQLNRSALMVRTGPAEMTLLDNERWASQVNDEIKDALRLEVQRRLGRTAGLPATWTKLTIDVDIQRFEVEFGRHAELEVSWSATPFSMGQRTNDARPTTCTFRAEENIRTGYTGMVEGYQREIAALADAIVAVSTSDTSGIDAACRKSIESSAG
jgi:uncharacterized protein